jgi:spore coat polysaccharide biosynthesis predicted glycosyltransferase SpsG
MKKSIYIFTEFSKKKGHGHYFRALRLKKILSKKYIVHFYINLNYLKIIKILTRNINKKLIVLDLKTYNSSIFDIPNTKFLIFEKNQIRKKNTITVDPLNPIQSNFNGYNWYIFPEKFKKKNIKKDTILIVQGYSDAHNLLKKITLEVILANKNKYLIKILTSRKIFNKNFRKKYKVQILKKIKNYNNLLSRTIFAVSGCGNFAPELLFMNINCLFVTKEPREIARAKIINKLKLGKFVYYNNIKKIKITLNNLMLNNYKFTKFNIKNSDQSKKKILNLIKNLYA